MTEQRHDAAEVTQEIDSGMSGEAIAVAELMWASLPTGRKWTGLSTAEKALVCHTFARHRQASEDRLIAKLQSAEARERVARAVSQSKSADVENPNTTLFEHLDCSGENKARMIVNAAASAALASVVELLGEKS